MEYVDNEGWLQEFTVAELRAIDVHKYFLSLEAGHDVGMSHAVEHWRRHHSARWRQERIRHEISEQVKEIMTHKWIESEKAGADLGSAAVIDWVQKYAAEWRRWREKDA